MTDQAIHALVQVCASNPSSNWILSAIYASLDLASRTNLWEDLTSFASSHTLPWLLVGDFNETLYHHETFSNLPPNRRRMSMFNDFLNNYNLMDLRYSGPRFTWTNKGDNGLVMKHLDRALANLNVNSSLMTLTFAISLEPPLTTTPSSSFLEQPLPQHYPGYRGIHTMR